MTSGRSGMNIEGQIKFQSQTDEGDKNLTLKLLFRSLLNRPVVESNLAYGDEFVPLIADKRNHFFGFVLIEVSGIETRRGLQFRVVCSQFNISLSIRKILAYGYDSPHAGRLCPSNNLCPISVENRIAQVGMRIYNSMIRKSQ